MFKHTIKAMNDEDTSQDYRYYFFESASESPTPEEIVSEYEADYFDGYNTIQCDGVELVMQPQYNHPDELMVAPSDAYPDMGWYVD